MHAPCRPFALGVPALPAHARALPRLLRPCGVPVGFALPGAGHRLERRPDVAHESDLGAALAAQVLGADVDLHDPLPGREERRPPVDEVRVEPGPEHERDVGGGERDAAVHEASGAPWVVVVDQAARGARRDHGDARSFREPGERLTRPREERAGAGEGNGTRRRTEQLHGAIDVVGNGARPSALDEAGLAVTDRRRSRRREHVLGDLEVGDAGRPGARAVHGLGHQRGDAFGPQALRGPFRDRRHSRR